MSDVFCSSDSSTTGTAEALLREAKAGATDKLGVLLQAYRNYLTILAATQLDQRLRRRMNPSDLVQEAMLAAHRDFPKFRGQSEREFLAWLRQILINCLHHAIEMHVKAKVRDVRCEVSIDQVGTALDHSVGNLAQFLADRGSSPSAPAQRRESVVALANRLAQLRAEYRDVVVLRGLQGMSFDEVAQRMGKSSGAVRMLWLRAIEKLGQLTPPEGD